ncbi:hypothetical protein QFC21_007209 [Naganishia friedmannii]|uniref:Uncharacterized protein n=1 Tax=Naganishia friedmannii TaxID=89922 RepID=A0ACC2UXA2_9TREE|nr:hypothetical protein QFC21_007209 [Naganishia friedmannii]
MASAGATFFTHPLDLTKVQMQTAKTNQKSTGQFFANIIRQHAALLRALTYSTFRFGAYEVVKTKWLAKDPSMLSMIAASAGAGGAAGLLGVPAEVVLIRMASDRTRPPLERYGYRNCVHGLYRITKDEGILALYRGVAPNVVRLLRGPTLTYPWGSLGLPAKRGEPLSPSGPSDPHERLPTRVVRLL